MEISPIPFTKFVFVGLQVYSHHSFFKFTPQSGTFCPKTVSICLKELVMIATWSSLQQTSFVTDFIVSLSAKYGQILYKSDYGIPYDVVALTGPGA